MGKDWLWIVLPLRKSHDIILLLDVLGIFGVCEKVLVLISAKFSPKDVNILAM